MTLDRTRWTWVVLAVCFLVAVGSTAWARPWEMKRDRTDNTQYFEWNAETDEIELQTSSRRFERDDKVDFTAFVRETGHPRPGRTLKLVIDLRLLADHAVRYDGAFEVSLVSRDGEDFSWTDEGKVTLRDLKQNRRASWVSRFDLPTGKYDTFVKFVSS